VYGSGSSDLNGPGMPVTRWKRRMIGRVAPGGDKPKARILVIDDRPLIRDLFREALEHDGHHITVAADGYEGELSCHEAHPDLVMVDLLMPGLDGFETIRQLRTMGDVTNPRDSPTTRRISLEPTPFTQNWYRSQEPLRTRAPRARGCRGSHTSRARLSELSGTSIAAFSQL